MVADGKRLRRIEIRIRTAPHHADIKKPFAPQNYVGHNLWKRHGSYVVIALNRHSCAFSVAYFLKAQNLLLKLQKRLSIRFGARPILLRRIIERWQIEIRLIHIPKLKRSLKPINNFAPNFRRGKRPPIAMKRKLANAAVELLRYIRRLRIAIHNQAAVMSMNGSRRDHNIHIFAKRLLEEIKPNPATIGAERIPYARSLHKRSRLLPEHRLFQILKPKPVGDNAMLKGRSPSSKRSLRHRCHRRKHALLRLKLNVTYRRRAASLNCFPP